MKTWVDNGKALGQLIVLTVTKNDAEEALFDLPTDKLMGRDKLLPTS